MPAFLSSIIWRLIIVGAVVAAVGGAVHHYGTLRYEAGEASADKKWTDKYNRDVDAGNAKIALVERNSREAAKKFLEDKRGLEKLLDDARTKRSASVDAPRNADGSPMVCGRGIIVPGTGTDTVVALNEEEHLAKFYLDEQFSIEWNHINSATNIKLGSSTK